MIRVLHLCSNHKVTGPAELALDTARQLERVLDGMNSGGGDSVHCLFVSSRHPRDTLWVDTLARERGLDVLSPDGLRLAKHFNPLRSYLDSRVLRRLLDRERIDLVHCHLSNDHMVAALARRSGASIPIVRTIYDGEPLAPSWRNRWSLGRACDHVVCFSDAVLDGLRREPFALPAGRLSLLDPPIDTERFDPGLPGRRERGRARLGLEARGGFTAGIVARMQRHRHFHSLLEAVKLASGEIPGFRFVIIGRGTHQEEVAREPVRRLGLSGVVIFAGYLQGEEYVETLQGLDAKVFLVPGSDGTCRAVREAMASGIPVVAARRGMLPRLVQDGETGYLFDDDDGGESPRTLARLLVALASDEPRRRRMAAASRRRALESFGYRRYVDRLREIYERIRVATPLSAP